MRGEGEAAEIGRRQEGEEGKRRYGRNLDYCTRRKEGRKEGEKI